MYLLATDGDGIEWRWYFCHLAAEVFNHCQQPLLSFFVLYNSEVHNKKGLIFLSLFFKAQLFNNFGLAALGKR